MKRKNFNGGIIYADWLKTLTPEEFEAHKRERAARKSLKQAHKEMTDHYKEEITATMLNLGFELLEEARKNKDANAYAILFDRLIGKPQEIDITSNKQVLPWIDFDEDDGE